MDKLLIRCQIIRFPFLIEKGAALNYIHESAKSLPKCQYNKQNNQAVLRDSILRLHIVDFLKNILSKLKIYI